MDFTDQDLENLFKKYFDSYKDKDINNARKLKVGVTYFL